MLTHKPSQHTLSLASKLSLRCLCSTPSLSMSSSRGNDGGLESDDQSKKVSSDPNEKVNSPVSLSVPCEDVRTEENVSTKC